MIFLATVVCGTIIVFALVWLGIQATEVWLPVLRSRMQYWRKAEIDLEMLATSKWLQVAVLRDVLTEIKSREPKNLRINQDEATSLVGQALVVDQNRVLLVKLASGPFEACWSLPAAYVEHPGTGDLLERVLETAKAQVCKLAQNDEENWSNLRLVNWWRLPNQQRPAEGRLRTDVYVVLLEIGSPSNIDDGKNAKWWKIANLGNLVGSVNPTLVEALRVAGLADDQEAERLTDAVERGVSGNSKFRAKGRAAAITLLKSRDKRRFYLRILEEVLEREIGCAKTTGGSLDERLPTAAFFGKLTSEITLKMDEEAFTASEPNK